MLKKQPDDGSPLLTGNDRCVHVLYNLGFRSIKIENSVIYQLIEKYNRKQSSEMVL